MFDTIRGKCFLTMLDCTRAFHALKLSPDAKKSAFITHLGKFQRNVASFGLARLPSYYSKVMQEHFAQNYMDDILIASYTENKYLEHIKQIFEWFRNHKMRLQLFKCKFLRNKSQFLRHMINYKGTRPLPKKNEEISKIRAPANANEVCTLLGLLNYYHRFTTAFADLMQPIQKLLKKNTKFEWTTNAIMHSE